MNEVRINGTLLSKAAGDGMDEFINVFVDAFREHIGGDLTAETMTLLNADQITLLAYVTFRDEVMDGGFVQLIHNGYGPFFFHSPFAKAMREWGLRDLYRLVNKAHKLYGRYHEEIERECLEEEFMALFERFPAFDDLDDEFVENEEEWTELVARYIDDHIGNFAVIDE